MADMKSAEEESELGGGISADDPASKTMVDKPGQDSIEVKPDCSTDKATAGASRIRQRTSEPDNAASKTMLEAEASAKTKPPLSRLKSELMAEPEPPISSMTVSELKKELESRGVFTNKSMRKPELMLQLLDVLRGEKSNSAVSSSTSAVSSSTSAVSASTSADTSAPIKPYNAREQRRLHREALGDHVPAAKRSRDTLQHSVSPTPSKKKAKFNQSFKLKKRSAADGK